MALWGLALALSLAPINAAAPNLPGRTRARDAPPARTTPPVPAGAVPGSSKRAVRRAVLLYQHPQRNVFVHLGASLRGLKVDGWSDLVVAFGTAVGRRARPAAAPALSTRASTTCDENLRGLTVVRERPAMLRLTRARKDRGARAIAASAATQASSWLPVGVAHWAR